MEDRHTVRRVQHRDNRSSYWIFGPDGEPHLESRQALHGYSPGTQQTYAYSLKDHLDWLLVNTKTIRSVTFQDLVNYMSALTGQTHGVSGIAWRSKPLGNSAARNVATIVKRFYISQPPGTLQPGIIEGITRSSAKPRTRQKSSALESNSLAPNRNSRHPRLVNPEILENLRSTASEHSQRDIMILLWLEKLGLRVGELCGLRLQDLHFAEHHECGQRAGPHIHIIPRGDNPNEARAKQRYVETGFGSSRGTVVTGGIIRTVNDELINAYYSYHLDEYAYLIRTIDHEMILVHLGGKTPGAPLTTQAVRRMIDRTRLRAGITAHITPHSYRHLAASRLYAASNYNAELVAQEFGWTSPTMVTETYGRAANYEMRSHLNRAWSHLLQTPTEDDTP